MARIAFFSDDEAGALCARLVCLGFSAVGAATTLALPEAAAATPAEAPPPVGISTMVLPASADAFEIERLARTACRTGGDLVAAVSLQTLLDRGARDQFDAVVAVGTHQASASRALKAARFLSVGGGRYGGRPAWFLAGPGQSELQTKARLAATGGLRLPYAVRALPMALPRITADDRQRLAAWEPDAAVVGTGLLLAALALCVAADPEATRLEAADVATLMAARTLPAERAVSDRLLSLADAYGRLEGEVRLASPAPAMPPARRAATARVGAPVSERRRDAGRDLAARRRA